MKPIYVLWCIILVALILFLDIITDPAQAAQRIKIYTNHPVVIHRHHVHIKITIYQPRQRIILYLKPKEKIIRIIPRSK